MLVAPPVVILRGYLTNRSDLITSHNLFLIGCSNFFGVAAIGSGIADVLHTDPVMYDVIMFLLGSILFFASLHWAYTRWQLPRRAALRCWRRSPQPHTLNIILAASATAVMGAAASIVPVSVPVIGQIAQVLGKLLPAAGGALCLAAWLRNPVNGVLLLYGLGVLAFGSFVSLFGAGRHPLLAMLVAPPLALYWMRWRYKPPITTVTTVLGLGLAAFALILVYSVFRHDFMGEADAGVAADRLKQLLQFRLELGGEVEGMLTDETVATGLLCIERFSRMGSPDYFHTVKYVLANPIPRDWWPNKPQALGEALPESLGEFVDGYVNWGTSIIGNAFHDGGLWMTVVYGLVLGFFFRVIDDVMIRQPLNPWPLAMLAAMSSKLIGFSRGDISVYTVSILGIIVVTWIAMKALSLFGSVDESVFHLDDDAPDDDEYGDEHAAFAEEHDPYHQGLPES